MSNPSKLLVVFGATGNQGGSVIQSVLADPRTAKEFKIRGITRDPSKENAQALAAKGVEMVSVSLPFLVFAFSVPALHCANLLGCGRAI